VKIDQYAYLAVGSEIFDPDQITATLGKLPTSVSWRGARSLDPMIPVANMWRFQASERGRIDDQVAELVGLLESMSDQVLSLAADGASWVAISVVRRFNDPSGVEEELSPDDAPAGLVKLPGQHQLLGFHLDVALMARLVALGCSLDVDEYG
jgi:Domain of unknown function (DUF4279)